MGLDLQNMMKLRPCDRWPMQDSSRGTSNLPTFPGADNERGRGPGGIAIRTGQPCIVRTFQ